jgi:hypothetical protein
MMSIVLKLIPGSIAVSVIFSYFSTKLLQSFLACTVAKLINLSLRDGRSSRPRRYLKIENHVHFKQQFYLDGEKHNTNHAENRHNKRVSTREKDMMHNCGNSS